MTAATLRDHVIVVGYGSVGAQVVAEIRRLGVEVAVIEHDPARLEAIARRSDPGIHPVALNALEREALVEAGVAGAQGFISTLGALRDNLFTCMMARHARPALNIVSRVSDVNDSSKFRTVGATVVNAARIGGTRLARLMILPQLADFADAVVASADRPEILRKIPIEKRAPVAGRRLGDANLQHRTGCVILGIRSGRRGPYRYHPGPRPRLRPGGAVIALGLPEQLEELAELLSTASKGANQSTEVEPRS